MRCSEDPENHFFLRRISIPSPRFLGGFLIACAVEDPCHTKNTLAGVQIFLFLLIGVLFFPILIKIYILAPKSLIQLFSKYFVCFERPDHYLLLFPVEDCSSKSGSTLATGFAFLLYLYFIYLFPHLCCFSLRLSTVGTFSPRCFRHLPPCPFQWRTPCCSPLC